MRSMTPGPTDGFLANSISVNTETTDTTIDAKDQRDLGRKTFADLVGVDRWCTLPLPIRSRFNRVFTPGRSVCYTGLTVTNRISRLGRWLAQAARLVAAPLPLVNTGGPVVVAVTDHEGNAGQAWCRVYHRERGFAQCIQSIKRFRGPTGLEEYLGCGIAMALELSVEDQALVFRSHGFAIYLGGYRIPWPRWLAPGALTVIHREQAGSGFEFEMTLTHPIAGELIHQRVRFVEDDDNPTPDPGRIAE